MEKMLISTKILPKLTSNHKPIQLLVEADEDLGPIPFRFSPLWIEREGFFETVHMYGWTRQRSSIVHTANQTWIINDSVDKR